MRSTPWPQSSITPELIMGRHLETYSERAAKHTNLAAVKLLDVIDRKQSNLCVSVDVTKVQDFLEIIDVVGPYVSLVKVKK